ncbi:MAG: HNH endonuclease [Patescibacteria group bacterium]|nr:HNH endonuclease [Patescibacteria group bacterium]
MKTEAERFWEKVEKTENCWIWTGAHDPDGYGSFRGSAPTSLRIRAHKWAFLQAGGVVPGGFQLDHLCRNRGCVRPDHLEAVTPQTNTLRGNSIQAKNARKTHCKNGHFLSQENTYITRSGGRSCRTCQNAASREYRRALVSKKVGGICLLCGTTFTPTPRRHGEPPQRYCSRACANRHSWLKRSGRDVLVELIERG